MTGLLPLYLRREPTTLPNSAGRQDVAAYRDQGATEPCARWPWHYRKPDRRNRFVMFNCYRWEAVWLPDLVEVAQ